MELAFAGVHQLCAPLLDRLERLPAPQRDALGIAFGLRRGVRRMTVASLSERAGHTESATLSGTSGGPGVQLHLAKRPPAGSPPSPRTGRDNEKLMKRI
jgi:hypothetical protein